MWHHADLDNGRHAASVWNAGAPGDPLLALHGFTGSGADFEPIAAGLRVPVLAPDLTGHGASPAPAEVSAFRMDRVVRDALAWSAARPRWVVLGYSMGGRVAMRLATLLGDRLAGLVLVSASPGIEAAAERAERATRDRELADAIERHGVPWFTERWAQHPLIRSQQAIPDAVRLPMQERRLRNRASGLGGSLRGMGQGAVEPCWHALPTISAPTLWITGDEDPQYTAIAARAVELMPRARHARIAGVGHCTHLEDTPAVLAVLSDFLARIAADDAVSGTPADAAAGEAAPSPTESLG